MTFNLSRLAEWFRPLLPALFFCALAGIPMTYAQDAASLKARYAILRPRLASNQFQRALYLESSESTGELKGDIYALIEQPYAVAGPALQGIGHWCDILILHQNVKRCLASTPKAGATLSLNVGRKYDQPLADAYQIDFLYKVVAATSDYLQVTLNAQNGPLGTSHYRIAVEVVALDSKHSFLHMSYSYTYGTAASMAMKVYLATVGRNKLGFSIVGHQPNGQPIYIGSVRGVTERNTMRYYLAIEAYLEALSAPVSGQPERRMSDWYAGIERYPVQLHEMGRSEYLTMKRKEIQRQQAQGSVAASR